MQLTLSSLCLIFSLSLAIAQPMQKVKLADGNIKLKVPKNFYEMTPEDMVLRIPSVRNPLAAYSSIDRMTDFNVKVSATQWRKTDTEIAGRFFKAGIYNLFDRVTMIDEGVKTINKQNFIVFEFESYLAGDNGQPPDRKYNYIMYFLGLGRTLVFSFRCPERQKEEYMPIVPDIVKSIKIKGM